MRLMAQRAKNTTMPKTKVFISVSADCFLRLLPALPTGRGLLEEGLTVDEEWRLLACDAGFLGVDDLALRIVDADFLVVRFFC